MSPPPKAILFDIGGVVVASPMSAIKDYETSQNIPQGWINFSISRSGPTGSWAKLERGELQLDAAFFARFREDLMRDGLWREFVGRIAGRRGGDDSGINTEAPKLPGVPNIDAEWLFWEMMRVSRQTDPHMLAAVKKLKASDQFLIAALSNTSIFPDGHEYNSPKDSESDVKSLFEIFVSSAHVGMRKPEPRIYELALRMLQERWVKEGKEGNLKAEDVVFLDDIGTNLSQGRKTGFRTIKVALGDTKSAIRELEKLTQMQLLDDAAKL